MLMLLLAILTPCALDPATSSYHQNQDLATISSFIARQARRERGEEYEDAHKVVAGDLNGDGLRETVVLYTIESQGGSNNYIQYLAVFARRHGHLVAVTYTAVGGKSRRFSGSQFSQQPARESRDAVICTEGRVMLSKPEGHDIVRSPRPHAT